MSVPLTESLKTLLKQKTFAHLATVMPDGSPQASPVWVDCDGDYILINSAKGRVKDVNIRANRAVALSITDPDNPYQFALVRGRVVEISEQGAGDHIDALAKKYMGQERFARPADQVRVIYKIEATHIREG